MGLPSHAWRKCKSIFRTPSGHCLGGVFSQVSYKGITSAFQADDASSSLATRSKLHKPPSGGFFVPYSF